MKKLMFIIITTTIIVFLSGCDFFGGEETPYEREKPFVLPEPTAHEILAEQGNVVDDDFEAALLKLGELAIKYEDTLYGNSEEVNQMENDMELLLNGDSKIYKDDFINFDYENEALNPFAFQHDNGNQVLVILLDFLEDYQREHEVSGIEMDFVEGEDISISYGDVYSGLMNIEVEENYIKANIELTGEDDEFEYVAIVYANLYIDNENRVIGEFLISTKLARIYSNLDSENQEGNIEYLFIDSINSILQVNLRLALDHISYLMIESDLVNKIKTNSSITFGPEYSQLSKSVVDLEAGLSYSISKNDFFENITFSFIEDNSVTLSFAENEYLSDISYDIQYNLLYLDGWEYIQNEKFYNVFDQELEDIYLADYHNPFNVGGIDFILPMNDTDFPSEDTFTDLGNGLINNIVSYDDFINQYDELKSTIEGYSFYENSINFDGTTYDVKTDLVDMAFGAFSENISLLLEESFFKDTFDFCGYECFPPALDCEVTPEDSRCPFVMPELDITIDNNGVVNEVVDVYDDLNVRLYSWQLMIEGVRHLNDDYINYFLSYYNNFTEYQDPYFMTDEEKEEFYFYFEDILEYNYFQIAFGDILSNQTYEFRKIIEIREFAQNPDFIEGETLEIETNNDNTRQYSTLVINDEYLYYETRVYHLDDYGWRLELDTLTIDTSNLYPIIESSTSYISEGNYYISYSSIDEFRQFESARISVSENHYEIDIKSIDMTTFELEQINTIYHGDLSLTEDPDAYSMFSYSYGSLAEQLFYSISNENNGEIYFDLTLTEDDRFALNYSTESYVYNGEELLGAEYFKLSLEHLKDWDYYFDYSLYDIEGNLLTLDSYYDLQMDYRYLPYGIYILKYDSDLTEEEFNNPSGLENTFITYEDLMLLVAEYQDINDKYIVNTDSVTLLGETYDNDTELPYIYLDYIPQWLIEQIEDALEVIELEIVN